MVFQAFCSAKAQMYPQIIEKALSTEGSRNAFPKRQNTFENQCEINNSKSQKMDAEKLIKTMVFISFWAGNGKVTANHCKSIAYRSFSSC